MNLLFGFGVSTVEILLLMFLDKGCRVFEGEGKAECKGVFILEIICTILAGVGGYAARFYSQDIYSAVKIALTFVGISVCMLVDLYFYIIPNRFLIVMIAVRVSIFLVELMVDYEYAVTSLIGGVVGAIPVVLILYIIKLLTRGQLGMGDVKLLGVIGFCTSLNLVLNSLIWALVSTLIVTLPLLLLKKKGLKDEIPFGPFIYVGYFIALVTGVI